MAEENDRPRGPRSHVVGYTGTGSRDPRPRQQDSKTGIPWMFYFGNLIQDDRKAGDLHYDTLNSLEPFRNLLNNLLDNSSYLSKISADVSKVESNKILLREFTLIRIEAEKTSEYPVPDGFFFTIYMNSDPSGDFEITNRSNSIRLNSDNLIDYYNGFGVFRAETPIQDKKLTMYVGDDPVIVEPKPVDYVEDFNSGRIRIEGDSVIESLVCDGKTVKTNAPDGHLRFFGKIDSPRLDSGSGTQEYVVDNGIKYDSLKSDILLVHNNTVKSVSCNGRKISFETLSLSEYPEVLGDGNLVLLGKDLVARKDAEISDNTYISNYGAEFKVSPREGSLKSRLRNGIFIQLSDNESYQSDVFGSSSFFFREEIETLSDVPNADYKKDRQFKIGSRYENLNIIEIAEVDKKGKTLPISDLPEQLYLVSNPFQTRMQKNAVELLINSPSKHHLNLLRLMRSNFRWNEIDTSKVPIEKWYVLTDDNYDGVDAQREMVRRSLCTNDYAFLEGPPGSGKTTTILEIISQMIIRGQKILLAASTHAAIDNILERLDKLPEDIRERLLVARVGNEGVVGDSVSQYLPSNIQDESLREIIFKNANLVCGTTFGILRHPDFKFPSKNTEQYLPALYDCLIIDEASKTTFQDFLVPAVFAKKWILSGDIKQLTPYVESSDVATSIRSMQGFDLQHQEIYGLIQNLTSDIKDFSGYRFTVPVGQAVISDINSMVPPGTNYLCIAESSSDDFVSPNDILDGSPNSMKIYGADILFVEKSILNAVSDYLPATYILVNETSEEYNRYAYSSNSYYTKLAKKGKIKPLFFNRNCYEGAEKVRSGVNTLIRENDWAGQIAWRISRQQELFMLRDVSSDRDQVKSYQEQIDQRIPEAYREEVEAHLNLLRELSMPSILQLLKQGVSENAIKSKHERKNTTLNRGFGDDYASRCTCLDYQNRMHSDISRFSREHLYGGEALKDNEKLKREWDCKLFRKHAVWENVVAPHDCRNENPFEAKRIIELIQKFSEFAKNNPNPSSPDGIWTVAILTYYKKQEDALKKTLSDWAKKGYSRSFTLTELNLYVEIFTVDKYQGKEADLVFISMVKSAKGSSKVTLGFMDSPNRLNVALTRARFQRVVVGNIDYFLNQRTSTLLRKLAEESQ